MGTITKIYRQTNSLALIIPAEIVRKLKLRRGQYIAWDVENGKIVIKPLDVVEEKEEGEEVKEDV